MGIRWRAAMTVVLWVDDAKECQFGDASALLCTTAETRIIPFKRFCKLGCTTIVMFSEDS
jgi:hypothetical protein